MAAKGQRAEATLVAGLASLILLFPLSGRELFPLTSARLFVDAPQVLTRFVVLGPNGRRLPAEWFGLESRYFGLDGYHARKPSPHPAARQLPSLYNVAGRAPDAASLRAWVGPRCAERGLPFVQVLWTSLGAHDARRVGVVASGRLRVDAARP